MSAAESQVAGQVAFVLALLLGAAGVAVYSRLFAKLQTEGGQVRTAGFDLPDLLVSIVLASTLGGLAFSSASRHSDAAPIKPEQVIQGAVFLCLILVGIGAFLRVRGVRLVEVFGLRRCSLLRGIGWAAMLLATAYPFVAAISFFTAFQLGDKAEQQPLIAFFRDAAARADYGSIVTVAVGAIFIAPISEEFLFRGYFYPVAKRYLGPWIGAPLIALIFAANHANLASLPPLFALAIALTLAYERTGSLLVPIAMHALFNAGNLVAIYVLSARGIAP